jgi:nicotinate-nucleotide adenylyltransferase
VKRRIGLLGGSFDPPHYGHLILADCALESAALDQLLFVPAGLPPHKPEGTRQQAAHRLMMLELALGDDVRFGISRADIDRPGPHYSVDLVQLVQAEFPDAELYFVMGGDSLRDLPKWNRPDELIRRTRFAVMSRPTALVNPEMHEVVLPGLAERVVMIDAPLIEISSTDIARRIREHRSVRYMLPPAVLAYIETHQLYQQE